jgi:polyphosphate kinase
MSLDKHKYIDRDISWLLFNKRVLSKAYAQNNNLITRLKFLAISASNLDEFFMIRLPSLEHKNEIRKEILIKCHEFSLKQCSYFNNCILPSLKKTGINFLKSHETHELSSNQKRVLKDHFDEKVAPIITISNSLKFNNQNIYLAAKDNSNVQFLNIPNSLDRLIKISDRLYILLEELVELYSPYISDQTFTSKSVFRVLKSLRLNIVGNKDETWPSLVQKKLFSQKYSRITKLEFNHMIDMDIKNHILKGLNYYEDPFYINSPPDLKFLYELIYKLKPKKYKTPAYETNFSLYNKMKKKDFILHHPYESFETIVNLLKTAGNDPAVLEIKQTIYRVTSDSVIVDALIEAAQNGKKVTVLMELLARLDEQNNLDVSNKLKSANINVIYGINNLKTHCKLLLINRREKHKGIRRYLHISTGNYNEKTAKLYTDISFFTSKKSYTRDAEQLFKNLRLNSMIKPNFKKFVIAPFNLREALIKHIDKTIEAAKNGLHTSIILKVNSISDTEITLKLYEASKVGVKIKLIVRGCCSISKDIKSLSKNIIVVSLIDKYLEHSRVFYFKIGHKALVFLSSADLMSRNLDKRIELLLPIDDKKIKKILINLLNLYLQDTESLQELRSNLKYKKTNKKGKKRLRVQKYLSNIKKSKLSVFY